MTKKILIFLLIAVIMMLGITLTGCETFGYNSPGCSGSGGCNAIYYCGTTGCAGYYGGKCNCN